MMFRLSTLVHNTLDDGYNVENEDDKVDESCAEIGLKQPCNRLIAPDHTVQMDLLDQLVSGERASTSNAIEIETIGETGDDSALNKEAFPRKQKRDDLMLAKNAGNAKEFCQVMAYNNDEEEEESHPVLEPEVITLVRLLFIQISLIDVHAFRVTKKMSRMLIKKTLVHYCLVNSNSSSIPTCCLTPRSASIPTCCLTRTRLL